jgi:hypothetical protein
MDSPGEPMMHLHCGLSSRPFCPVRFPPTDHAEVAKNLIDAAATPQYQHKKIGQVASVAARSRRSNCSIVLYRWLMQHRSARAFRGAQVALLQGNRSSWSRVC